MAHPIPADILTFEELEQILDELCRVKDEEVVARINATTCQTTRDHRHASEMHVAFLEARDLALSKLRELLQRDSR